MLPAPRFITERVGATLIRIAVLSLAALSAFLVTPGQSADAIDPIDTIGAIGDIPTYIEINESTGMMYAADDSDIRVIDQATNTAIDWITLTGTSKTGLAVNETMNLIYRTEPSADTLTIADGSTNQQLISVPAGDAPEEVAVNQSTNRVYVSSETAGTVTVLFGATHSVIATIPVANAGRIVVDESRNQVYVLRTDDDAVAVVDGANNQVVGDIPVADAPMDMALDEAGGQLFVINQKVVSDISVIDLDSNSELTRLPATGGRYLAFHNESNTLWVTRDVGSINVIDGSTYEVRQELYLTDFPFGIEADADSDQIYAGVGLAIDVFSSLCGFEDSDQDGEGDICDSGWEPAPPGMAIDVDTAGNSATSLGPTEVCRSVSPGNTFDVDVVVYGAPLITGFSTILNYDPNVLRVTAEDANYLLSTAGPLLDLPDYMPDGDGRFRAQALSLGSYAGGSGVLSRITLEVLTSGVSPLALKPSAIFSSVNEVLHQIPGNAVIWAGQPCPAGPNDADQDGVDDGVDVCPFVGDPAQADKDSDGYGDWCDDGDGDTWLDVFDLCPHAMASYQVDADGDSLGDECDPDKDDDGVLNLADNAPYIPNPGQEDTDGDGIADVLDLDVDGDGVDDKTLVLSITADLDGDGDLEDVSKTLAPIGLAEVGYAKMDSGGVHVFALGGSMHVADLDGDGEDEIVIKDPGQAPGLHQSYDINKSDPDSDPDVVVLGGGAFGLLVPDPVDIDSDGELESLVWEPELYEGEQLDLDIDIDGDADVQWGNTAIAGIDNCPGVANPAQTNSDNDAYGDACDDDDDNDGYEDTQESAIGTSSTGACGEYDLSHPNPNPDIKPSLNWPSDLNKAQGVLDSFNRIDVLDLTSFMAPVRYIGTDVGTNPGDARFDLRPGPEIFGTDINVADLTALIAPGASTGAPPMLGGVRAMGGPVCPWPP